LAPNHFTHATALEHLADVCTARGKFAEALQFFLRAYGIRQATLGNNHPSLRTARERIADLQLQASEDSFDVPSITPPLQAHDFRSTEDLGISSIPPAPRPRRETRRRTRPESTIPFVERELTRPVAADDTENPPATNDGDLQPAPRSEPLGDADEREAAALAYRATLLEERQNAYDADEDEAAGFGKRVFAAASVFTRKYHREALVVTGVMAFLVIAIATSTRASSETDQTIVDPPPATPALSSLTASHPLTIAANQPKVTTPDSAVVQTPKIIAPLPSATSVRIPEKVRTRKAEPATIAIPSVATPMTSRFDSIVRAASAPVRIASESIPVQLPSTFTNANRPKFNNAESSAPVRSHARLIGVMPVPRYPELSAALEGEVIVRFQIDTAGKPVMTTFSVASSPDPSFTAAVQKVIPGMRFEPARLTGPGSRAIYDNAELRFLFSKSRR
jgi:TonB family protein